MTATMKQIALLTVGAVAATSLIACVPKDDEKGDLDHETARQAISGNTKALSSDVTRNIEFLDRSELFNVGIDRSLGVRGGTVCEAGPVDPETGESTTDCYEEPSADVEVDLDVESAADMAIGQLEERVLADANVESESGSTVTYLLRGDVVCASEGVPADPACVEMVDDAEIRLVVSSPAPGNVDVDLQVGPDRANPLSAQFHRDLLALEVDLGGIKASADHIGSVTGEPVDLPQTFEGRLRAELQAHSDTKVGAALSILSAIEIADGEWSFSAQKALPAYAVTIDGQAETVEFESNLGTISGLFPVTDYDWNPDTGEETETTYDVGFHFAASTATALFDAANEVLTFSNVGLDDTSTISVNGEQVVAIDVNDGAKYGATITSSGDDSFDIEVDPKFDLRVALQLMNAADVLQDIEEWMLDEVLTVTLDGAAKPTLRFHDDTGELEVLDGTLELSLQNEGTTITASAGQCLIDTIDATTGTDESTEPVEEEPWTPLSDLAVDSCQQ